MSYSKIALVPADGSKLTKDSCRYTNMVSSNGKVTITFENKCCFLTTEKGRYRLKESYDSKVYYTVIGKYYTCFNGSQLCWRDNS